MASRSQTLPILTVLALLMIPGGLILAKPITWLDLGGRDWQLTRGIRGAAPSTQPITANVPGDLYSDLLAAKVITDPFYRNAEADLQWVAREDWTYRRTVSITDEFLAHANVRFRCQGLDTVATIWINGKKLADTDNMFRTWSFDARPLLHVGDNELSIEFHPIGPYIERFKREATAVPNAKVEADMPNLRKAPYSNGWDFGPKFLNAGIYKPIELVAFDAVRLDGCLVDTNVRESATVMVRPRFDGKLNDEKLVATLKLRDKVVATSRGDASQPLALTVDHPELWWPNGYGEQPLYDLTVELQSASGERLDLCSKRIGLRTIEFRPKTGALPPRLAVNGREIFLKGLNWIPCDVFTSRVTPGRLRQLIADAARCNVNILRTWGGGYYEDDAFYDACDELGLLVWSEFKFACAAYPGGNPAFEANVRAEVNDQVMRLQSHPSIAVWSGNNECEAVVNGYKLITEDQYDHFFRDIIGGTFKSLVPTLAGNFVEGSPGAGDEHNWFVWHIGADFEKYRESHGLISEFGFQSFPNPHTVASFTDPADRDSVLSETMKAHQHNKNGNAMILDQMAKYFRPAKDFDSTLWLSQINQGWGMCVGIEHWRTDWPASSGSFVWQYDDDAPGASWSSVDYFGRWKAAQYLYRRAYAPLMISGVIEPKSKSLQIAIAGDGTTGGLFIARYRVTDLRGREVVAGDSQIDIESGKTSAQKLSPIELHAESTNALVWLSLIDTSGQAVSKKLLTIERFKALPIVDPELKTTVKPVGDGYDVTLIATAAPALFAWLDCDDADARYSDNFVDLDRGESMTIHLVPSDVATFDVRQIRSRSLFDTHARH